MIKINIKKRCKNLFFIAWFLTFIWYTKFCRLMASIVKRLRPRIVVPICVGSNPTTRPIKKQMTSLLSAFLLEYREDENQLLVGSADFGKAGVKRKRNGMPSQWGNCNEWLFLVREIKRMKVYELPIIQDSLVVPAIYNKKQTERSVFLLLDCWTYKRCELAAGCLNLPEFTRSYYIWQNNKPAAYLKIWI